MKITVLGDIRRGVPLSGVPIGAVVARPMNDGVFYLVVSPMDGTGNRWLVTLGAGVTKYVAQDTEVIVLGAEMLILGERSCGHEDCVLR